ncbi:hypothetical protein CDAR_441031, partial [Caerostris darwini]
NDGDEAIIRELERRCLPKLRLRSGALLLLRQGWAKCFVAEAKLEWEE